MSIQERKSLSSFPEASTGFDAGRSGVSRGYITPAATFTATTASSASGGTKTTLTSAGAHGLTSAVAVNKHLYISAGTNWTAGFYNISSIDVDTTGVAVTIDVAYNASFGSPTIALAGTEVTFRTIQIPPLGPDSIIEIDATWTTVNSGNIKQPIVKLEGNLIFGPSPTTIVLSRPSSIVLQNRGATNAQVSAFQSGANSNQNGTATLSPTTTSVETSVATSLTIGGKSNTANEFVYLDRYIVKVFK